MSDAPITVAAWPGAPPARAVAPPPVAALLFLVAPGALLALGGGPLATALFTHAMFWTTVVMLSRTRGFQWRDLWPRDGLSETWLLIGAPLAATAAALAWGRLTGAPAGAEAMSPALLAPFAVTVELAHRVLPLRRVVGGDLARDAQGALATALLYFAAAGGAPRAALFGFIVGGVCGRLLARTGHFPLICLTHAAAVVAMATLGPGLR